jgi:hypothetical protein
MVAKAAGIRMIGEKFGNVWSERGTVSISLIPTCAVHVTQSLVKRAKGHRSEGSAVLGDMIWKANRRRVSRLRWHSVRRQNLRQGDASTESKSRQQCD